MFGADVRVPLAVEEVRHLRGNVDRRGGDRAHFRDAIDEAGDDARRCTRHRVLVLRECAEEIPQPETLKRIVIDQVQRELRIR